MTLTIMTTAMTIRQRWWGRGGGGLKGSGIGNVESDDTMN